ncbi:MAG: prepilin-type N-terminal cleavage/methylation domain-containing protein [Armatimonadetes bacterium]|nr:prepilin-type N-terminal cleavage/methylation domain-containing protein [Armatimonadota bacterium]
MFYTLCRALRRDRRGFTLIELVIVLAILGGLAALLIPRFASTADNTDARVNQSNHRMLQEAVDLYRAENGGFPSALNALVTNNYIREVPKVRGSTSSWGYDSATGVVTIPTGAPGAS